MCCLARMRLSNFDVFDGFDAVGLRLRLKTLEPVNRHLGADPFGRLLQEPQRAAVSVDDAAANRKTDALGS